MSTAAAPFDVPGWLATVSGVPRDEIALRGQSEDGGSLSSVYLRGRRPIATVDLVALPMGVARRGVWQLVARLGTRIERVQLPAGTRFEWR